MPTVRLLLAAVMILLGSLLPARALAGPLLDDPIRVDVALEPATVKLGDQTRIRVTVTHTGNMQLQFPDAAAMQATGLDVIRMAPGAGSRSLDGTQTSVTDYVVAGFAPKVYDLPDVTVNYQLADGSQGKVTVQPVVRLTVESVLANLPNPSLRDIRPPIAIPQPPGLLARPLALAALTTSLLLLALLFLRRALMRRRPGRAVPLDHLSPEEAVRVRLKNASEHLKGFRPDYAAFYTELSVAVREYLERRTTLAALSSTTRELRRDMELRGTDRWHARIILGLLDECDAVKWAHYVPDPARADRALTMAYEIVDLVSDGAVHLTRPQPGLSTAEAR